MAVYQGIVDPAGRIVRNKGTFKVLSKTAQTLRIEFTGQKVAKAYVLATPWRADGDIGPDGVSASPDPLAPAVMIFAVRDYYGLSFRLET
ncbi:MAG: hypothetical protein U1F26_10690 [Lysobacterales bacterium]